MFLNLLLVEEDIKLTLKLIIAQTLLCLLLCVCSVAFLSIVEITGKVKLSSSKEISEVTQAYFVLKTAKVKES